MQSSTRCFTRRCRKQAYTYALPLQVSEQFNFRKYGFHGLSYQYVSQRTAELLGQSLEGLNMIIAHLGTGGSSVAAIKGGSVGRYLDRQHDVRPGDVDSLRGHRA